MIKKNDIISFGEAKTLAILLDDKLRPDSIDFKELVVYIFMNWTRSYTRLRLALPPEYDKSLIERCRQRFIYRHVYPKYMFKIFFSDKADLEQKIEFWCEILCAEGHLKKEGIWEKKFILAGRVMTRYWWQPDFIPEKN